MRLSRTERGVKMKELHMICNAHLDPVWLWQKPEGIAEAISTFRVAADFCDEFDLKRDEETDSVSVGGWITEQLGKIPSRSDRFDYEHLHVIVTETDSHRVVKAKVLVLEKEDDEDHAAIMSVDIPDSVTVSEAVK